MKYVYTRKEKSVKKSAGDCPERTRIYKMLPIFGKGKVNSNSHAGGARGGGGEASKQNKSKPWSLNGIKLWAFVCLFVL